MPNSEAVVVFCTFPDAESARRVTATLVEERLVACAQRTSASVQSIYRWQGATHDDAETLVLLKTTRARWEELVTRLEALHPYEVPQVVGVPAITSDAYGRWLDENTAPDPS